MACTIIWRERALPMLLSSKRRSLYVLCTPGLGRSCCFYLAHDFELDYVALLYAYCLALDYELDDVPLLCDGFELRRCAWSKW